ncbi:MAG TPA: response regulator [Nevskiaceae bacterium]|nr:response regulator [Nevskiaceae bacterium]
MSVADIAAERLREITDRVPGAVYQWRREADGRVWLPFISAGVQALGGVTPEEGQADASILLRAVHPEDRGIWMQVLQRREEGTANFDFRIRHRGDRLDRWIRNFANVRLEPDGALVLNGCWQDITETRELEARLAAAEQRVRDVTESLPGVVYEMHYHPSMGSRMVYVTDGTQEVYGIPKAEVLADATALTKMIPLADRARMLQAFANSLKADGPMTTDFRIVRPDGQTRWLRTHSARRRGGDVMRWIGHTLDVTEAKLLEQEVANARAAAEAANAAKSEFLANMSHEIRTPMNAVIGLAELALRTQLDPRQRDYLEKIHGSAHSLLGIINDILDFSKIEAGKLSLENTTFQLADVLDNMTDVLGVKAQEKRLEFAVDRAADVPDALIGDPLRLGQVLLNLAGNAVKFTESGGVRIRVERVATDAAAPQPGDETWLRFSIEDTGIGLDRDQVANLFRPFSQADTSTTRRFGGSGLGLSISKQLVDMMGGQIFVTSEPGQGSTFAFTARFTVAEAVRGPRRTGSLEQLRVLVADDSAEAREVLREHLHGFGCEVHEAASGTSAVERVRAAAELGRPFDLVLLDWQMPGINGIDAARLIRASGEALSPRTMLISAYGRPELAQQVEALSLDGLLLKPINVSTLHDSLMQLFGDESTPAHPHAPAVSLAGLRVLVVEDKAINQQVARELLEGAGIGVELASDGQQAVDALLRDGRTYDAVLMDLQMPVMDGLTATRRIRAEPRHARLPIIAMTANAMSADREKCLLAGMNDHIGKPVDVRVLLRTLAKWTVLRTPQTTATPRPPTEARAARTSWPGDLAVEGYDLVAANERLGGDANLLRKLARSFVEGPDELQALCALLAEGRRKDALIAAHSLKGIAASLGAEALREAAATTERTLKGDGDYMQEVSRLVLIYGESRQRLADWVKNG